MGDRRALRVGAASLRWLWWWCREGDLGRAALLLSSSLSLLLLSLLLLLLLLLLLTLWLPVFSPDVTVSGELAAPADLVICALETAAAGAGRVCC